MATKKKSKAKAETALVRRERAPSALAAPTTAFEKQTEDRLTRIENAVLSIAERVADDRGRHEAPTPLFTYAIDVDYLRSHDVLLVSVEIQNNNLVDLSLDAKCLVGIGGNMLPEMPPEYAQEIELEGVEWVKYGVKIAGGQVESYAWAFEAQPDCIGQIASVGMKLSGQAFQEEVEIRTLDPARQPTQRKAPKLLTGGTGHVSPMPRPTDPAAAAEYDRAAAAKLDVVGGAPAQLASSPWRRD